MKGITKDNKGITLVSLIITIIIMSILVSVTTYSGINTYRNAKITNFVAQMQLIQTKVDDLVETRTVEEINSLGLQEITTNEQKNAINSAYSNQEIVSKTISEYKVFTTTELLNVFDIDDIENDIMVNFTTREVVSANGIEYDGTTYYTQYKLPNGQVIIQNTTQTDRDLEFSIEPPIIDGLNATITINNITITNGTISYKEQSDTYWNIITNYTKVGETYNISVSKSGTYEFILTDNVTGENSNNKTIDEETQEIVETVPEKNKLILVLTNEPNTNQQTIQEYNYNMDSDNWAYVSYNDITYLWIPRFAYKTDTETNEQEIKFLKGNSNIATDNTYIVIASTDSNEVWTVHEKFKNNGVELTGIWVKIERQIDLDMVTLLNSNYEILTEINV